MTETRPIGSAILMLNLALEKGFTAQECLRNTDISQELIKDANAVIQSRQELLLIENLEKLDTSGELALELGQHYHLTSYGIWGFALATSANLRSAIEVGLNYQALTFAFSTFSLHEDQGYAFLQVSCDHLSNPLRQFVMERDASAMINIHRELFSPTMPIKEIHFDWGPSLEPDIYHNLFGITPKFHQAKSGVLFKRELLDLPLPSANEGSRKILMAQCQDLLDSRHKEDSTARRVRNYILVHLDQNISMQGLADTMSVSLRTLRRMLHQEDTSFRRLLDEVRETLALELIQNTQLSLEEISYRLGYSDTANFFHAFKRWRGHTPNKLRSN